jgi:hypothetical protein
VTARPPGCSLGGSAPVRLLVSGWGLPGSVVNGLRSVSGVVQGVHAEEVPGQADRQDRGRPVGLPGRRAGAGRLLPRCQRHPLGSDRRAARPVVGATPAGAAGPGDVRAAGRRLPSRHRPAADQDLPHHQGRPGHRRHGHGGRVPRPRDRLQPQPTKVRLGVAAVRLPAAARGARAGAPSGRAGDPGGAGATRGGLPADGQRRAGLHPRRAWGGGVYPPHQPPH